MLFRLLYWHLWKSWLKRFLGELLFRYFYHCFFFNSRCVPDVPPATAGRPDLDLLLCHHRQRPSGTVLRLLLRRTGTGVRLTAQVQLPQPPRVFRGASHPPRPTGTRHLRPPRSLSSMITSSSAGHSPHHSRLTTVLKYLSLYSKSIKSNFVRLLLLWVLNTSYKRLNLFSVYQLKYCYARQTNILGFS